MPIADMPRSIQDRHSLPPPINIATVATTGSPLQRTTIFKQASSFGSILPLSILRQIYLHTATAMLGPTANGRRLPKGYAKPEADLLLTTFLLIARYLCRSAPAQTRLDAPL